MLGDVRQPGLSLTSEFFNHISNILICQLLNIFLDLLKYPHRFSGYFQNLKSFFTDARWQLSTPLHENSLHGNFQTRHFRFDDCDYDDDQFESCYFLFVQKMRINIFFKWLCVDFGWPWFTTEFIKLLGNVYCGWFWSSIHQYKTFGTRNHIWSSIFDVDVNFGVMHIVPFKFKLNNNKI